MPRAKKPHFAGFGSLQQFGTLCGMLAALYGIYNSRAGEQQANAALQGTQKEALANFQRADERANERFQRLWDYLPGMRRDMENDLRRDIDNSCRCCRQ